ncbi:MAG: phosphoribosylglycinamide formyltransferase [Synergistetes bacterium]|nr:phosphoribosylglycinamide formyltransferase [Synergistota bacterium]MDW8192934.1 phosphoribosylglycinamide formyltransferase [Synergistota bacterium]
MKKVAVLASGRGSNFEALAKKLKEEVKILIVDRECGAIERAKRLNIPWVLLQKPWQESLKELLAEGNYDLIALAGFMRIIPEDIVREFYPRIINIHPAILPAFPGINSIERAYKKGVKLTGITIHIVTEKVDDGPIILQRAVYIRDNWSLEKLESVIHRVEHIWYPWVVKRLLYDKWEIRDGKVIFL